ncbi:hypothetical protein BGZ46_004977, partial [Entomortierella lignicola]
NAGVDLPPFVLDLQCFRAYIYTIKRFNSVYGAGNVTDQTICLPTGAFEMYRFFSRGSFAALFNVKILKRIFFQQRRLEKIDEALKEAVWDNEEKERHSAMKTSTSLKHINDDIPTIWTPSKRRKNSLDSEEA